MRQGVLQCLAIPLSLNMALPISEPGDPLFLEDTVGGNNHDDAFANIYEGEIFGLLTDIEQKVYHYRFGLDWTQTEISEIVGVSQVQVSRIERKIKKKAKEYYEGAY
jgi:RNA polymerase sporulation-specific sigma factor